MPGSRLLVLFALAAIALAAAVGWLAPASLLDSRLARATGGVVRLVSAQGTLWNGRGVVTAANTQIPVAWNVDSWPLLRGAVRVRVRSDAGANSPRGIAELASGVVTLQDWEITLPAALVASALGDMAASSVDGEVTATASSLRFTAGASSGEARLVWRNARLRGVGTTNPLELGEVRAGVIASGPTMTGPIDNEGGNLAIRGEWTVKEKDAFSLALLLTPRKAADAELTQWLSAVGAPDGNAWRIDWRLPLR